VSGLNINAPVKYRGVDVGKVNDIRRVPDNAQLLQFTFAIEHGTPVKTAPPRDSASPCVWH
jgi:phospholipid/cholesterol/gamma-HCH transport system substrate-binding protein